MPVPGRVRKLSSLLSRAAAVLATVALAVLTVQVTLDVALRAVLGQALDGTIEFVSAWWMPIIIFLALGLAQLRDDHISVTFVTDGVHGRVAVAARVVWVSITVATLLLVVYYSWGSAMSSLRVRESTTGLTSLPVWPFKFLVPVGLVIWAVQIVTDAFVTRDPDKEVA